MVRFGGQLMVDAGIRVIKVEPSASPPRCASAGTGTRMFLSGDLPDSANPPPCCAFVTRCPFAMDMCREIASPMTPVDGGGVVACHLQTTGSTLAGMSLDAGGMSAQRESIQSILGEPA